MGVNVVNSRLCGVRVGRAKVMVVVKVKARVRVRGARYSNV